MEAGVASHTARSVAARRLRFERAPAGHGDPEADLALTRDVAGGLEPSAGRMNDYLRARTSYFDRVVVRALERGVAQVVIGAAGYDGRALRYAKRGVRWFEVDHPATQADKLQRLARLGLDTRHIAFVPADFRDDPVAARLREAGLDARRAALFLFEGIAVYLEDSVTESVLRQFREVTTARSLLAISFSVSASDEQARSGFRQRVAAIGEPAKSALLQPEQARELLARAGWDADDQPAGDPAAQARRERLRSLGLLTARAAIRPAAGAAAAATPAPAQQPAARQQRDPAPARQGGQAAASEPDASALPLYALASRALVAFTIEADNEAERRLPHFTTDYGHSPDAGRDAPWLISLAMWASGLRLVPDDGITVAGLRQAARVGTNLPGLRRWGYLTFDPEPVKAKKPDEAALIRLTRQGLIARDEWARVAADVADRWAARFGAQRIAALREALAAVVARLPGGLPDCLPILGFGLVSRISQQPRPPAGADSEPGDLGQLPLWALLSRLLLAFAAEYDEQASPSLAVAANVLRLLSPAGVRSSELPALAGISKEAAAWAIGDLTRAGLATEGTSTATGRWRLAALTPRGERAQARHGELAQATEASWAQLAGPGALAALRSQLAALPARDLLAGIAPDPGGWRARRKPLATLPWYPMTLHRGGYPDGS